MSELLAPEVLKTIVTVLGSAAVAALVAYLGTRRDVRQASTQRHFAFADDRSEKYAKFLREVNLTWAAWWEAADLADKGFVDTKQMASAKVQSLELDTQMNVLRITSPENVQRSCGQVNGMLQMMITSLEMQLSNPVDSSEYENAKHAMMEAMRADIALIESAKDRKEYVKLAAKN